MVTERQPQPPELVEGILHQGCKMVLSGTSKSNKTWCLLDLALSVGSGQPWWGRKCKQARVVYINFELPEWALRDRLDALLKARPECVAGLDRVHGWNLRGHSGDLARLRPDLEEELAAGEYGLVILDPAYKLLGDRDENSNGEIADLMNQLELLAQSSGAAVVLAHHFAKGDAGAKGVMDRMSGAGVWARDPDALLVLTPHEEEDCYTVSTVLRHVKRVPDWVVAWEYPLMRRVTDLNPEALRSRLRNRKMCGDGKFLRTVFATGEMKDYGTIMAEGVGLGMSRSTTSRYLKRQVEAGILEKCNGKYWKKEVQDEDERMGGEGRFA